MGQSHILRVLCMCNAHSYVRPNAIPHSSSMYIYVVTRFTEQSLTVAIHFDHKVLTDEALCSKLHTTSVTNAMCLLSKSSSYVCLL